MCGIGGVFLKSSRVSKKALQDIAVRLRHRGPDEDGFYLDDEVGMVHTRLSIIDIHGGKQPLCDTNKDIVLIANGEIYNFKELREGLALKGRNTRTLSDSEVLLYAYLEHGVEFIKKITGMFAFALWDRKERRLMLARDRLGIKPLYLLQRDDGIFFASEIKALIPFLKKKDIDPASVVEALQNQFSSGAKTIFKHIKRVLPGEAVVIEHGEIVNSWRYWDLSSRRFLDRSDYLLAADEFNDLFETVMVQHMRADVPYGVFLSGGVDSATILYMLSTLQGRRIFSFSLGYNGATIRDELEDARHVARLFNTEHVVIELTPNDLFSRVPFMVWATDEFMWDYACLPTTFLAQAAKDHSLKVVFTGEGGDEVFAGYGRYRKGYLERMAKRLVNPGQNGFRSRGRWRRPWPKKVFGPELRRFSHCHKEPFETVWRTAPCSWDYVKKAQYTDMMTELPDDLLVKVDRSLMGFGVEGRVPFLDHRVVEFGMSLSRQLKVRPHFGKVFLRRWAEKGLPSGHLWKKKRGFSVPIGQWLSGRFLDALEEKLMKNRAVCEWFEKDGIQQLFMRQRQDSGASREIWGLMHFAIWHNLFVEQSCSAPPSLREDPLEFI